MQAKIFTGEGSGDLNCYPWLIPMKNWPTWELKENAHGGNTFGTFSTTNQMVAVPGKITNCHSYCWTYKGKFCSGAKMHKTQKKKKETN